MAWLLESCGVGGVMKKVDDGVEGGVGLERNRVMRGAETTRGEQLVGEVT